MATLELPPELIRAYEYQKVIDRERESRHRLLLRERERALLLGNLDRLITTRMRLYGKKSADLSTLTCEPKPDLLIDTLAMHLGVCHIRTALYNERNPVLMVSCSTSWLSRRTKRALDDANIWDINSLLSAKRRWWPGFHVGEHFIAQIGSIQRWELWRWCIIHAYDHTVLQRLGAPEVEMHASAYHFPRFGYPEPVWTEADLSVSRLEEVERAIRQAISERPHITQLKTVQRVLYLLAIQDPTAEYNLRSRGIYW